MTKRVFQLVPVRGVDAGGRMRHAYQSAHCLVALALGVEVHSVSIGREGWAKATALT